MTSQPVRSGRLAIRRLMLSIAAVTIGLEFLDCWYSACWVGHAQIPLNFLVLDASTGKPLQGASLRFVPEDVPLGEAESIVCEAVTDAEGRARLVHEFLTFGYRSFFRRTRHVEYSLALKVEAPAHEPRTIPLGSITHDLRFHDDPVPPQSVIRLASKPGA